MNTQPQENNVPAADSRHTIVKWLNHNKLTLAGFFGWYIVNGLLWMQNGSLKVDLDYGYTLILNLFILPINLAALVIFAVIRKTRKIAFGILIALALNFIISLLLGLATNAQCFIPFIVNDLY